MYGKVLWYDQRDGHGVILDGAGNEYYVDNSVAFAGIKSKDLVSFEVNPIITNPPCAHKVTQVLCEGGNVATFVNGRPGCEENSCQECCEHDEHDHFICLNCEKELDPSSFGDEDYGQDR